jgi:sirohydrochlorin ferrochelatase
MSDEDTPSIERDDTPGQEEGSDELLSDDALHLPDSANVLVRLHAVRAWLARNRLNASAAVGEAALALQQAAQALLENDRPRRRLREGTSSSFSDRITRAQAQLQAAQETLSAFEEAQSWLEECVAHTNGERVLVEYYLLIEQALLDKGYTIDKDTSDQHTPWRDTMVAVLRRIEHVGIPEYE